MLKILITINILLASSISIDPEKNQSFDMNFSIKFLLATQNKDGSWGDKNKIYCSSIALLNFLAHGETHASDQFGKTIAGAMRFLCQEHKLESKDLPIYFFAISQCYLVTGIREFEEKQNILLPILVKSLTWDYQTNPHRFFIQSFALQTAYTNGMESRFLDTYSAKLSQIKSNNLAVIASQTFFKNRSERHKEFKEIILKKLMTKQKSPFDDWILARIAHANCFYSYPRIMDNKLKSYLSFMDKYAEPDDRFSLREKEILQIVLPYLTERLCCPTHWLPTFKDVYSKNEKAEVKDLKGLDLIE